MKIYCFNCGYEWYFTEGSPVPESYMTMFFVDVHRQLQIDEEKFPYIRGWSTEELQNMFKPISHTCVLT